MMTVVRMMRVIVIIRISYMVRLNGVGRESHIVVIPAAALVHPVLPVVVVVLEVWRQVWSIHPISSKLFIFPLIAPLYLARILFICHRPTR